jgi:Mg-chelatase subunit ChlD
MVETPIAAFQAKKIVVDSVRSSHRSSGKRIIAEQNSLRGKCVGARRENTSGKPHILQTVIAQATSANGLGGEIGEENLRWQVLRRRAGTNIIFLADSSGSMLAQRKIEAAKGCVLSLLEEAYVCRDTVSLITFGGKEAKIVLPPTASPELAYELLKSVPTGGKTPLIDALAKGQRLMENCRGMPTLFVLISDGKYSRKGIADPEQELRSFGETAYKANAKILVIDAEKKGIMSLRAAKRLADQIGGIYKPIEELRADTVRSAVDSVLQI